MTKQEIKALFCNNQIGFDYACQRLMSIGFTKFAAEQYLYAE